MSSAPKFCAFVLVFSLVTMHAWSYEMDPRLMTADSLFRAEDFRSAERLYTDVLTTAKGIDRGIGLKGIANLSLYSGEIDSAEKYYNDALKIFKQAKYLNGEAKIYLNLGVIALYRSDRPAAEKLLNKALATNGKIESRTSEEQGDEIQILEMLGQSYMVQSLHDKAFGVLHLAVEKSSAQGYDKGLINGYYLLGGIFQQTAGVDSALICYGLACSLSIAHGYFKSAYDACREAGNVERKMGRYDRAYDNLLKALGFVDAIKGNKETVLGEGELLYDIGLLYVDMGKMREALDNFFGALRVFEKVHNTSWKTGVLQSIGHAYLAMARTNSSYYDSSLYYYQRSKSEITDKKDESQYHNNLGIVYDNMNDLRSAEKHYCLALEGFSECGDSTGIAHVLGNLGNLEFTNGRYEQAVDNYQAALAAIRKLMRKDWEASLLSNLGYAQHAAGRIDDAIVSLSRAADIIEELRGKIASQEFRSVYLESKLAVHEKLVDLYCQKGKAQEAFNCAERAKARAFLDLVSGIDLALRESLDPAVKALMEKEQELEKKVEFLTGDPRQSSAIIEHNDILRQLVGNYPDYAALKAAEPIDIKDLQGMLDDETAVVEYFLGANNGYIFVITNQSLGIKQMEASPVQIFDKVDYYRKVIKRKVDYSDMELADLSTWFYAHLLEPIGQEIKGKRRLCIVPYGVLHDLPFAAVMLQKEPLRLLIDDYDVFYAPSASVYRIAHSKNKAKKENAVIFAKSRFRDHTDWYDLPLPGTIRETDSILAANALPRVMIFSDGDSSLPQPTETRAKEILKDYDIIHFATHGKLAAGDSALDSRVILTADANNDGNLKVREIFNMNINAYLVSLSACETGQLKGFSGAANVVGDELTGLTRAFIYAGTPSVVASLWKVSDMSTALLMARFYKNLISSDKTGALCEAQRWLRNKEFYDRPFFWAPFVVIGDWR